VSLRVRAVVGALVLAVALACTPGLPAAASAHAELLGTVPGMDELVDDAPDDIALTFSEDVSVELGGVKVFAPDGSRADTGKADVDGARVVVPVDASERGSYAASWRITSADGHPVAGSFVFHVGERSGSAAQERASRDAETDRTVVVAYGVARGFLLLGVLVAAGGAMFSVLVAPGWRPRLVRSSLVVALFASLVAVVLDASVATGLGVGETLRASVLGDQLGTVYGRATAIRVVMLLAALSFVGAIAGPRRRLALVPFVLAAMSLSLAGHAVAGDPAWARVGADMLHVLAACAWLGGLVQLVPAVRAGTAGPHEVRRYSNIAFASVVVLLVTGLYAAWSETGLGLDALRDTTYGRLVLVKSGLFVVLLGFGAINRRITVPGIVRGEARSQQLLRRFVLCELVLLVGVIAATAWLIETPPQKDVIRPKVIERTLDLDSGGSVQLIIDPAIAGTNTVHVHVITEDQKADAGVDELQLQAVSHKLGIHRLDIPLEQLGPGGWSTETATLPGAGRWAFTVIVRHGEFDEDRVTTVGEIAPASSNPDS
jgi:copper transport protein